MARPLVDWNSVETSDYVNIGTHRLHLTAFGPSRKPGDAAVLLIPGVTSSITGWAAVQRQLAQFIRVYSYDRTGYGESDTDTQEPTATIIAHELDLLLRNAQVAPPFIIVGHSWGGIISREFLALRPDSIAGMVFVDANQEHTLEVLDWRVLANSPVLSGVDHAKVIDLESSHKLTNQEWEILKEAEATEKHQKQAALEFAQYAPSFPVMASKGQLEQEFPILGSRPVCVIKGDNWEDWRKLFRAGVEMGNGNKSERAAFENVLQNIDEKDRDLQRGILKLSSRQKYFEVPLSGHNVHLTAPEAIVSGIKWVVDSIE